MNDRNNLLGSIMPQRRPSMDASTNENQDPNMNINDSTNRSKQPTRSSASASRQSCGSTSTQGRQQHKLKQRFSVIRKLGKGTYGKVQLAINRETGREVAIKTIKKSKIENEQDLERVRREIQIMSSIEHPHIIHIYEVFENKDKIVLVMQYAPGGELYEYVSHSRLLDDCEARRIFRQIATAIFYCHQNKICHRDLKLENILLDEKNNAKLADFGLSTVYDKQCHLKTFCGSPLYASPEIVQGSPYEGPEVDCWSLGVLLYTLVYGAMPFDGSNFKLLVKQISEANYFEPKPKSRASPLIKRLLCADPKKRANIMDICADPWVNGAITSNPEMSPQTSRKSLLQVAQDMANLTPARLDILMTLLPTQIPQAERSPLEQVNDGASQNISKPIEQESQDQVEVANYIVRNLVDPDITKEMSTEPIQSDAQVDVNPSDIEMQPENTVIEDQAETEMISEANNNDENIDITPMQVDNPDETIVEPMTKIDELQTEPSESIKVETVDNQTAKEIESTQEVKEEDHAVESRLNENEQANSVNINITPEPMDINKNEETNTEDLGESRPVSELDGQVMQENEGKQQVVESDKPKKVKKKIVVVKKKRKVTGTKGDKDTVANTPSEPKKNVDAPEADNTQAVVETHEVSDKIEKASDMTQDVMKETVAPIPVEEDTKVDDNIDNKSSTPVEQQKVDTSQQKEADVQNHHPRRKSTLIADVSQKLMMQLEADAAGVNSPNANLKSDQAQLIGQVRVSDKKDEYERRASLLQASELPRKLSLGRSTTPETPANLTETSEVPEKNVEELITAEKLPDLEASQKSTNIDEEAVALNASPETVKQDVDKLHTTTVTCDIPEETDSSIRSTFEINLMNQPISDEIVEPMTEEPRQESRQSKAVSGLVPITRSYKKVTFTKDGACITETGKIYSTRADDGTMRRIERKSKITHYPAVESGSTKKTNDHAESATYSECSEVVYEDNYVWPGQQGSQIAPEFERLIMPSQFQTEQNDYFSVPQSPFTSRMERMGSASSCSSGSTDAFDDIFENWTGAISMFGHNQVGNLMSDSDNRDRSKMSSIFSTLRRPKKSRQSPHRVSTSVAGSPRCGSVEPQQFERNRQYQQGPKPRFQEVGEQADISWDRDPSRGIQAPQSSAMSSCSAKISKQGRTCSRSDLRSTNIFFENSSQRSPMDDFEQVFNPSDFIESSNLFDQINQRHMDMHRKITQRHKQLWKGSTPSLFSPSGFGLEENLSETQHRDTGLRQQQRFEERNRSVESSQSHEPQVLHRTQHSQSSSSSKVFHTSIALDAKPRQKNTADIAQFIKQSDEQDATSVQRAMSKTSVLASQLSQMRINTESLPPRKPQLNTEQSHQHHTVSFIELKQQPSSMSSTDRRQDHQSKMVSKGSINELAASKLERAEGGQGLHKEETESRIQSWLQESSSNLSSSSGSKSSTSFSTFDGSAMKSDRSFNSLYGSVRPQHVQSPHTPMNLPPKSPYQTQVSPMTLSQQHQSKSAREQVQMISGTEQGFNQKARVFKSVKTSASSSSTTFSTELQPLAISEYDENQLDDIQDQYPSSLLDQLKSVGYRSMINQRMMQSTSCNQNSGAITTESSSTIVRESISSQEADKIVSTTSLAQSRLMNQSVDKNKQVGTSDNLEEDNQSKEFVQTSEEQTTPGTSKDSDTPSSITDEVKIENLNEENPDTKFIESCREDNGGEKNDNPSSENQTEDPQTRDEDQDEDIREAKAYVKAYVDRIRETEIFLKAIQAEEEEAQRQLQQINLFGNINFGSRFHSYKEPSYQVTSSAADLDEPIHNSGYHSAPVRVHANPINWLDFYPISTSETTPNHQSNLKSFTPSFSTYKNGGESSICRGLEPLSSTYYSKSEFEPRIKPMNGLGSTFRSSLGHRRSRPLSMSIDTYDSGYEPGNNSISSRSRHSSLVRRDPITFDSNSPPTSDNIYMTEYQRAYGSSSISHNIKKTSISSSNDNTYYNSRASSPPINSEQNLGSDDDIDDSMSSYRASSYVPKVVPRGRPERLSRSRFSRSNNRQSQASKLSLAEPDGENQYKRWNERRTSLQISDLSPSKLNDNSSSIDDQARRQTSPDSSNRRRSLQMDRSVERMKSASSESRLSELEERIQANKKRREELLAASKSVVNPSQGGKSTKEYPNLQETSTKPDEKDEPGNCRRNSSPVPSESQPAPLKRLMGNGKKLVGRPSRLESMEARIKRRSYFLRVGDDSNSPDRRSRMT